MLGVANEAMCVHNHNSRGMRPPALLPQIHKPDALNATLSYHPPRRLSSLSCIPHKQCSPYHARTSPSVPGRIKASCAQIRAWWVGGGGGLVTTCCPPPALAGAGAFQMPRYDGHVLLRSWTVLGHPSRRSCCGNRGGRWAAVPVENMSRGGVQTAFWDCLVLGTYVVLWRSTVFMVHSATRQRVSASRDRRGSRPLNPSRTMGPPSAPLPPSRPCHSRSHPHHVSRTSPHPIRSQET